MLVVDHRIDASFRKAPSHMGLKAKTGLILEIEVDAIVPILIQTRSNLL